MYPYLIRVGQLSIPAYPVLYGLGIAVSGLVAILLGHRRGLSHRRLATLILLLAGAIVIGGRAFYVVQHWAEFHDDPRSAVDISEGGQVFYGGLLLAIPVFLLYCRITALPTGFVSDAFAVGVPLGHAFGRLGCFCRGCCYGQVSEVSWAVQFPKFIDASGRTVGSPPFLAHVEQGLLHDSARLSLAVHPSQIYASGALLLMFVGMVLLWRSGRLRGRLLLVYVTVYACARFLLEMTRDNEMAFWGLTIPQVVSAVIALGGLGVLQALRRRDGVNDRKQGGGPRRSASVAPHQRDSRPG